MNPMTVSVLGVIFVVIGFITMLLMLELRGNPKERANTKMIIWFHRIFGYLFAIFFMIMLVAMISRTGGFSTDFSPRVILHVVFALMVGVLLGLKILMVRRYKRLVHWIMGFGIIIFVLSFLLNAITAGYFFLSSEDSPPVRETEESAVVSRLIGPELVKKKCTLCHSLDRITKGEKSEDMWSVTVDRMAGYHAQGELVSPSEKKQIVSYLANRK